MRVMSEELARQFNSCSNQQRTTTTSEYLIGIKYGARRLFRKNLMELIMARLVVQNSLCFSFSSFNVFKKLLGTDRRRRRQDNDNNDTT
jgi:hypothetical protein